MAMELSRPKKLHKHAVPIILLGVAGIILSLATFSYYGLNNPGAAARDALLNRTWQLSPARNGLAHIRPSSSPVSTATQSSSKKPLPTTAGTLGEVTELTVTLRSSTLNAGL